MKSCNLFKLILLLPLASLILCLGSCKKNQKPYLNESDFRDRVYACWLGKNIGGTLGMPFEGDTNIHDITFYTKLKDGEPAANDDLDLQILWLKAMQENNAHVDAFTLGKYWLKYIPVNWNEYGVGKRNMQTGLMPPVSGEYNNAKWKNSNGAWIRSEIWACLFPGNPMMAAEMGREDACVDHGMAEGTYAEIFTASVESAAFFESDRDSLINFGLSMIPPDCRTAKAVKTAIKAKNDGKDWKEARTEVVKETKDLGWFQAPRNVAFTMIGWLYGGGDFGKSICIAINCGDDTDCTGATLASIFGIIGGTRAIPENWRKPIGDKITNVAISGFAAPSTLGILTDSTITMTKRVIKKNNLSLTIGPGKSRPLSISQSLKPDKKEVEKLWKLSPWRVVRHNRDWVLMFDYLQEPLIQDDVAHNVRFSLSNVTGSREIYRLSFTGIPGKLEISGVPTDTFSIKKNDKRIFDFALLAKGSISDTTKLNLILTRGSDTDNIPVTFFRQKTDLK